MAHPADALLGQPLEEGTGGVIEGFGLAVFPGGIRLGRSDLAAQMVGHQLAAVANAQNRHTQGEHLRVHLGRCLQIHTVGTAGENNTNGVKDPNLIHGHGVGLDLTIYAALPDPAGDELVILAAKIQNQNFLHVFSPPGIFIRFDLHTNDVHLSV